MMLLLPLKIYYMHIKINCSKWRCTLTNNELLIFIIYMSKSHWYCFLCGYVDFVLCLEFIPYTL